MLMFGGMVVRSPMQATPSSRTSKVQYSFFKSKRSLTMKSYPL